MGSIAELSLGRKDANSEIVFYHNKVGLTCGVEDDYSVSLSYGTIDADYSSDQQVAGGQKEYGFYLRSTNENYTESEEPSNRAGDRVYLEIGSHDVDFHLYKFSVLSCLFTEMDGENSVT